MKEILYEALKKCEDAEVYLVKVEKYPVKFSGNQLKSIKSQLTKGIGLRVKKDGRIGFSSDTDTSCPEAMVNRAIASAKLGPRCNFDFCSDKEVTPVDLFDPRTVSFEIEEAVEMGQSMIDVVVKEAPETVNEASVTKYFVEVTLMTRNTEKTYYKTLMDRHMTCMQVMDDGFIYISEGDSSCRIPDDVYSLSRNILEKLPLTQHSMEMHSGPTTVIYHPKAMRNFTRSLEMGLSGANLVAGSSPLKGKFNRWIMDQRITIADDPTIALGAASEGFDGEGMARKRQVLFDRGVLSNYLLDLNTATKLGLEPNACAARSSDTPPSPGSSNLVINGGDTPIKDMIASIKDGLLVEEVIGGGQSNVIAGEFSLNISLGFHIHNGAIAGRVKNTMVAGNVYELLKSSLEAVSVETETHGSLTSPYLMFSNMSVSGRG